MNAAWSVSHESACVRLKSAKVARTVVESGTGDAACLLMLSIRTDGMKGGTSYGKALMMEEMPRTAESIAHDSNPMSQLTSMDAVEGKRTTGDSRAATSASWYPATSFPCASLRFGILVARNTFIKRLMRELMALR